MEVSQNIERIVRYYDVLKQIHTRLAVEGYFVAGGRAWNVFKFASLGEVEIDYE